MAQELRELRAVRERSGMDASSLVAPEPVGSAVMAKNASADASSLTAHGAAVRETNRFKDVARDLAASYL